MERFYLAVKRVFIVLLVFHMIYENNFIVRAQDIEKSVWNKVAEIAVGDGRNEIAYFLPEVGGFNRGPEAVRIASSGEIVILDSINNRALYVRENKIIKVINFKKCIHPLNFCLSDNGIYVLDESDVLFCFGMVMMGYL